MRLTVTLDGQEPYDVHTRPVDNVRFEDTARKHKWGSINDAPMRYMYFCAFNASVREGRFDGTRGFDAFIGDLVNAEPDAGEDEDAENPTPGVPGAD